MSHKNIISFQNFIDDAENGSYIIITEYFPSINLRTFIADNILTMKQKINIFDQILKAIQYMHKMNIVHRDLNVNNILINPETEEIKLIDFGLSRKISPDVDNECFSPSQGQHEYQVPGFFFESWILTDFWGLLLIYYSVNKNRNYTSKKLMRLLQNQRSEDCLSACKNLLKILIQKAEIGQLSFADFASNFLYN